MLFTNVVSKVWSKFSWDDLLCDVSYWCVQWLGRAGKEDDHLYLTQRPIASFTVSAVHLHEKRKRSELHADGLGEKLIDRIPVCVTTGLSQLLCVHESVSDVFWIESQQQLWASQTQWECTGKTTVVTLYKRICEVWDHVWQKAFKSSPACVTCFA